MRLRTYLLRRTIHTVITLVVVLVLLFVLFRLMPGDPTRFFTRPNQTPADRDAILVSFGFSHFEPAPGHGYRTFFTPDEDGTYQFNITVTNATRAPGRAVSVTLYLAHSYWFQNAQKFHQVSYNVTEAGSSDAWAFQPGDTLTLITQTFRPVNLDGWENMSASAFISSRFAPGTATVDLGTSTLDVDEHHNFTASFNTTGLGFGVYDVNITYRDIDNSSKVIYSYASFPLNPSEIDIRPFAYPAGEAHLAIVQPPGKIVSPTVNITGPGGIGHVSMDVIGPDGRLLQGDKALTRPTITVRNNVLEEFVVYMRNMLVLDFGKSFYTRQPVWDEIAKRLGPTMLLFGSALVIGSLLGIGLGAVMAWRRGSKLELGTIVVSLFFNSMPVFWLGLVLIWVFSVSLNCGSTPSGEAVPCFPLGGFGGFQPHTGVPYQGLDYVKDVLWHLVLPLSNLIIIGLAGSILLMRNSMLEVLGEDYIMTARAKGLSERSIMYRHAARNAMLPVVTSIALSVGGVISGGVLTETIFTWPGMGYYLVSSTLAQDFPAVQGAFYLLALITIFSNMVADVMYAFLDPRVRL